MAHPMEWTDDGAPASPLYRDRFHAGAPLAQARAVFLAGCDLPQAWKGARHWCVLENGFGFGANFLATWALWRADPERPSRLHYVATEGHPVAAADLARYLAGVSAVEPELTPLTEALRAAWWGLTPGFHRLDFESGALRLTIAVGDVAAVVPEIVGRFDSLLLDGFSPDRNPAMWSPPVLAALGRKLRPGARAASWCVSGPVRRALVAAGFDVHRLPGLPPKRERLSATYAPRWTVDIGSAQSDARSSAVAGLRIAVIGAGLAGAAVALSLAQRDAVVSVITAGRDVADGASALPAGLMAPQHSRDDMALMTQLTRAGIRSTLQRCNALLRPDHDFAPIGCLQRFDAPHGWQPASIEARDWTQEADARDGVPPGHDQATEFALWHRRAGWIKPRRLIEAQLQAAKAEIVTRTRIEWLVRDPQADLWRVVDADGRIVMTADRVVVAAGPATVRLVPGLTAVRAVAGQLAWAEHEASIRNPAALPRNGAGHWLPAVASDDGGPSLWLRGSTYEPGDAADEALWRTWLADVCRRDADVASAVDSAERRGVLRRFIGVRATTTNRIPRLGVVDAGPMEGVGYLTGLGSRGLSLAVLCGETLAALLAGEPCPVPRSVLRLMQARTPLRPSPLEGGRS